MGFGFETHGYLGVLQNRVDQLKASLFKYTEITSGVIPVRTTYIEVGSKIDAQISSLF